MPDTNDLQFVQRCLKCNGLISAENYTCTCSDEDWTNEYRMVDVRYELSQEDKKRAIAAFHLYDLNHPRGILQYFFTPHREFIDRIQLRVGLTGFVPLPKLSKIYGTRLFLKNEGDNPSGCFKDRETVMAALHSLANEKQKAVIYSSGNAAASASLFARHLDMDLITCVAGDTYAEKIRYIRRKGSSVIRIGNMFTNFEKGYRLFAKLNSKGFFVDHGFDNWSVRNPYRVLGDKTTAIEIVKQYRQETGQQFGVPDYVVVPTGNGSCLAGIWRGFKELKKLGIIRKYPRMVSAAIKGASPVYKAYQKQLTTRPAICDLENVPESDKEIGSTILAEEGYDSVEATKAVLESEGTAMGVTRLEIRRALIDLLEREGENMLAHHVLPEPASLTSLAVIQKMRKQGLLDEDTSVVALISGHGAKAKSMLMKMLFARPKLQILIKQIIEEYISRKRRPASLKPGELMKIRADVDQLEQAFLKLSH